MLKRYLIHLQFPLIVSISFGSIVGYCLAPILGVMIGLLVLMFGVFALKVQDFAPGINQDLYKYGDFNNVLTDPAGATTDLTDLTHPNNFVTDPAYAGIPGNIYHHNDL